MPRAMKRVIKDRERLLLALRAVYGPRNLDMSEVDKQVLTGQIVQRLEELGAELALSRSHAKGRPEDLT
jgi:hypothetical protein